MIMIELHLQEELQQYSKESKHHGFHDREYLADDQNTNYQDGGGGEVGECYHQGEEETEAYNGFENGEIRYETNGGYQEDDGYAEKYDRSSFEGNADLMTET